VGALVEDVETGERTEVRASVVINCTGVWTDDIQTMAGGRGRFHVRASKGVHIVVARDRINSETGLILRTEKSVLFVIPWGTHWIIGTTDTDWALDKSHPAATRTDIDYLLDHVNRVLATPLTHEDVEGVYAGLRPLLAGESESTSKLSREHVVTHSAPGLVVVAGGKYTTYRVMAKDAVDEAVQALPGRIAPSTTESVPLLGGVGFNATWNQRHTLATRAGLHVARVEHLMRRYGALTHELLALVTERPELATPVQGAEDYLCAEIVYAASHEGALHLTDVLTRRTRVSIEAWDRGVSAAPQAAALVAPVLGWDAARTHQEIEIYLGRVEAERVSQTMPDDASADEARRRGPDEAI
jgi:glycerol-3-phosphate dehydrogenase